MPVTGLAAPALDKLPIEAGGHCLFLGSRHRHFHDAARQRRFDVFQVILPSYGIVAA